MRKEFFNRKQNELDLHMVNCGYEDCCPNFLCAPHIRNYYLIHYVVRGEGFYEACGKRHSVGEGEIFVIYPGEIVTYYSPSIENPWSFCWVGIDGKSAEIYLSAVGISRGKYVYRLENPKFLSEILNCIDYIESAQNNPSQIKLNACVLNCLHTVEKKNSIPQKIKPAGQVEKAVRYIEYNYMNAITVKDVTDYIHLDRTYFYRVFKKYTGSSPEQYILKYRIKKALELMESGRYTFTQIAAFVGIGDIYYFSRLFKKMMGVSPSEYKSSMNKKF